MIYEATEVTVVLSAQIAYEPARRVFLVYNTISVFPTAKLFNNEFVILFQVRHLC
jgi:hypothetical protein